MEGCLTPRLREGEPRTWSPPRTAGPPSLNALNGRNAAAGRAEPLGFVASQRSRWKDPQHPFFLELKKEHAVDSPTVHAVVVCRFRLCASGRNGDSMK